jgi:hypothetical protein
MPACRASASTICTISSFNKSLNLIDIGKFLLSFLSLPFQVFQTILFFAFDAIVTPIPVHNQDSGDFALSEDLLGNNRAAGVPIGEGQR